MDKEGAISIWKKTMKKPQANKQKQKNPQN